MENLKVIIANPYDIEAMARGFERMCTVVDGRDVASDYSHSVDALISEYLSEVGIPPSLKGYRYIITAVKEVMRDETVLEGITKILYPNVAKIHCSTSQRVEKAIRHAIEVAWSRNDGSKLKEKFRYATASGRTRPTNSEFIAILSENIKLSY